MPKKKTAKRRLKPLRIVDDRPFTPRDKQGQPLLDEHARVTVYLTQQELGWVLQGVACVARLQGRFPTQSLSALTKKVSDLFYERQALLYPRE